MRVSEKILSCVVFIGLDQNGSFTALGTGFLAVKSTGGRLFQHVITARHVIENVTFPEICVRINTRDGRIEHLRLEKSAFIHHPNKAVDVAVCPTHVAPEKYDILHINLDRELLTAQVIKKHQIGLGDDVFMAGMFTSHIGDTQNRPIVRIGTIAAMTGEKIQTNRGLAPGYLIEARSIAGLSGSPVFLQMAPLRVAPDGEVIPAEGPMHYFMGLMQGHFLTADPSEVISPDEEYAPGDMTTGIGIVVPAEQILEVVNLPQLANEREAIVERMKRESGFVEDSKKVSERPTKAENPRHKEDFTRLLGAATKGRRSSKKP